MHSFQVFELLAFAVLGGQALALPTSPSNHLETRSSGSRTVASVYNWSDSDEEMPNTSRASKDGQGCKRKSGNRESTAADTRYTQEVQDALGPLMEQLNITDKDKTGKKKVRG
ncbi:uncharacterized protein PpBr36_09590 [Pyricularia pennisetigena]|uniref:uncharacterized protein n=1 Tax=Pyricularia pennisetigena TaxID=1578925 RepID=UPI0011513F0E|nr:uncharacterized protein PpBr36_09590 [Pyricularia pennisetigena]TLS21837.1 hypothetical protein PpBr36_09590 [Pyricularia pennisetigena]